MRKRVVPGHPNQDALADEEWLHIEGLAEVEVTSEALGILWRVPCWPSQLRDGAPAGRAHKRSGFTFGRRNN